MNDLYGLKEMLINELASYNNGRLNRKDICEIDILAHATKNICKIIKSEEESGYSNRTPHMNVRYSNHSSRELADELRRLMADAPDEASRQDFQRLITKLETM